MLGSLMDREEGLNRLGSCTKAHKHNCLAHDKHFQPLWYFKLYV